MDVLATIKADHNLLKEKFGEVQSASGIKSRRVALDQFAEEANITLSLGRNYLYPELDGLFAGADALITSATAECDAFEKKTKSLQRVVVKPVAEQKSFSKKIEELDEAVKSYIHLVEEAVMPKIRAFIRTEDREDLAEVFGDAREELKMAFGSNITACKQKRKRA